MSAIEFNVGDKVRIKNDLTTSCMYGGWGIAIYMMNRRGKEAVIDRVYPRGFGENPNPCYTLRGYECLWTDEMLDFIPEEDEILTDITPIEEFISMLR